MSSELACLSSICWNGGRAGEVVSRCERVVIATTSKYERAAAMVTQLNGLFNIGRMTECALAHNAATLAVQDAATPVLVARYEYIGALLAYHRGDRGGCLASFRRAEKAAVAETASPGDAAKTWHSIGLSYSYVDLHDLAAVAMVRAQDLAASARLPTEAFADPGADLRRALSLDYHGDAAACQRLLRTISDDHDRHRSSGGLDRMRAVCLPRFGYAMARHAALGEQAHRDIQALLAHGGDSVRARDLRQMGEICLDIAAGHFAKALVRLCTVEVSTWTLPAAEKPRLRAIAYAGVGDWASANTADRHARQLAAAAEDWARYADSPEAPTAHLGVRNW